MRRAKISIKIRMARKRIKIRNLERGQAEGG